MREVLFDPSPYYARGPVVALEPRLGYDCMLDKAHKLAPKFWGIPPANILTPPVPDIENRLIQLKNVLKDAPYTEVFGDTASWAYDTTASEIKRLGEQVLSRVFKIEKSIRKSGPQRRPPASPTRLDVFRSDDVAAYVLKNLQAEGDPVAETIIALTSWRIEPMNPKPEHHFEKLGHAAFELLLFASRSEHALRHMTDFVINAQPPIVTET